MLLQMPYLNDPYNGKLNSPQELTEVLMLSHALIALLKSAATFYTRAITVGHSVHHA